MLQRRDHMIERFEAWWMISIKLLGLFVENVEKDRCEGSIFGNQFHFMLMCGNEGLTCPFNYKNVQYIHFVRMWLCGHSIAESERLWIIDAPLTLTLHTV